MKPLCESLTGAPHPVMLSQTKVADIEGGESTLQERKTTVWVRTPATLPRGPTSGASYRLC